MKTFKQLQDDALRWYDEAADDDELRDNVKQAINAAHKARLHKETWPFMKWPAPVRFSTVVGQKLYALHQKFQRPIYFYNVTAQRWMRQLDDSTFVSNMDEGTAESWLDGSSGGDWASLAGSALHYELRGMSPVHTQPPAASTLTATSSSGADSAKTLLVEGETADGVTTETLTVGTPGSVSFTNILRVTKIGTWSGTMTLTASSGSTVLLKLFAAEAARQFQLLYLFTTPTAVETVEYHFYRKAVDLTRDLPEAYHDLLVYDALLDLATYNPGTVDQASMRIWSFRQAQLEEGLINTHKEATALEREVSYVRWDG
jgi:hypothetical protein